jgi:carotenoid cleavage dioxygenase-like enzyme
MTDTSNRYLAGNFAPVREELTTTDLRVTGTLPRELVGRLLRIGPNPVGDVDPAAYHWFTGSGMVHGVRLRDGRAEWYRRRFVRDDHVCAQLGWPALDGPRCPMGNAANVANTNVVGHAGRTWAIVEGGGQPVELTWELESVARSDFDGTLGGAFTAHPKRDPATGELHAVAYYFEWDHLRYLVVGTDGRVRRAVDVPVDGKPMVHDCALTARHVLLFDLPVTFDVEAAMSGVALPYRWNPAHPARVGILPRDGDAASVRWVEVAPCFVFHPLNAYDLPDGRVVVDVVRHPRMFAADVLGPNEGLPSLWRWTLDPAGGRAREQQLDDRGVEFPRHDERLVGRPHRYGYTATFGDGVTHGPAHKWDLATGRIETHHYGRGRVTLEPVFVPRAADAAEDDGWVLSYVHDATTDRSDVVVLHAQDFTGAPVATIHLPDRVPFGFHGNWVPD